MILEDADDSIDVERPGGDRIRVKLRGEAARHPDVVAGLVQLLLEPADRDIYEAVTAYAAGNGLGATYYLGTERVIIDIVEPLTLRPLVNASGGSPQVRASRYRRIPVTRPLARLLRLRAPTG